MQKNTNEYIISDENEIHNLLFDLIPGDRIFFYGDLGAWKTTFIRYLLQRNMNNPKLIVRSPTYTYYQKYNSIYHCDLYRIENHDTWISIWWDELLSDNKTIFLIEWPEILWDTVIPTKKTSIELIENWDRKIIIETC